MDYVSDWISQTLSCKHAYVAAAMAGFVHITNPSAHSLEPNHGVIDGLDNVYMISAMHQLHCLQQLQKMLVRSANDTFENSTVSAGIRRDLNHASHCFDYLKQSVLCSADDTLEGPDENPEPGQSPLRGVGVEHHCRSWDGLLSFRDEHSISHFGS